LTVSCSMHYCPSYESMFLQMPDWNYCAEVWFLLQVLLL
jgi:hypothetical protein